MHSSLPYYSSTPSFSEISVLDAQGHHDLTHPKLSFWYFPKVFLQLSERQLSFLDGQAKMSRVSKRCLCLSSTP